MLRYYNGVLVTVGTEQFEVYVEVELPDGSVQLVLKEDLKIWSVTYCGPDSDAAHDTQ